MMERHQLTLPPLASLTTPSPSDGRHPSYQEGAAAGSMHPQQQPSSSSSESYARPRTTSGSMYNGDVAPAYQQQQQQQVQRPPVASRSPPPPMAYSREQGQMDPCAPTTAPASSSNWPHPSYQQSQPLPPSAPPAAAPHQSYHRQQGPGSMAATTAGRMRSYSRPEPFRMMPLTEGPRPATSVAGIGSSRGLIGGNGQHYQPCPGHVSNFPLSDAYEVRASTGIPSEGRRESDESANSGSSSKRNPSESASGMPGQGVGAGGSDVLHGFSKEQDGRRYELVVIQSPSRARMCGFGDKDRRPLSPTLIVRLVVTDVATSRIIPPSEVDTSGFFLAADLVHPEDLKSVPRNLLVHQHASTISTDMIHPSIEYPDSATAAAHHQQSAAPAPMTSTFDVDRIRSRSLSDPWRAAQVTPSWHGLPLAHPLDNGPLGLGPPHHPPQFTTVTTETYTRNFVGASVASANVLKDESDQLGIFFILQDLSVRTEGLYRIKLMFTDLSMSGSSPAAEDEAATAPTPGLDSEAVVDTNGNGINESGQDVDEGGEVRTDEREKGIGSPPSTSASGTTTTIKAPTVCGALAGIYTDPFTVYTPRRFPGVIEPTTLSKKFAAQGVKIPVRVDRKKRRRGDGDRGAIGEEDEYGAGGEDDDYGDEY